MKRPLIAARNCYVFQPERNASTIAITLSTLCGMAELNRADDRREREDPVTGPEMKKQTLFRCQSSHITGMCQTVVQLLKLKWPVSV
jgi:hypothetical protein